MTFPESTFEFTNTSTAVATQTTCGVWRRAISHDVQPERMSKVGTFNVNLR